MNLLVVGVNSPPRPAVAKRHETWSGFTGSNEHNENKTNVKNNTEAIALAFIGYFCRIEHRFVLFINFEEVTMDDQKH